MRLTTSQWLVIGIGGIFLSICVICAGCTTLAAMISRLSDAGRAGQPTQAPAFPILQQAEPAAPSAQGSPVGAPAAENPPPDTPPAGSAATEAALVAEPTPTLPAAGGLGQSRAEWEALHQEAPLPQAAYGAAYDGAYDVIFQEDKVWYLERQWPAGSAPTADEVEAESRRLIPDDSQLVETYRPEDRPETVVNLYSSEWLKDKFAGHWWTGGEPGNFIVMYNVYDFGVGRMIITIGNNP